MSAGRAGRDVPAILSFLIADIRGYTRYTAEHGDEAAARLAARFAELCAEGTEAWGGQLLELRGDEALAVFASPRAALRAAVELQAAFAAESALEPDLPLTVGIGLDAGEAVAVGDGYRGAALNLAARLCSTAAAGQVIASAELAHLAGRIDGIDYAHLQPASLKGVAEPIVAVDVRGAPASAPAQQPGDRRPQPALPAELEAIVPLAGRQAELRFLAWHWRRATHGAGRTVVIAGPPGMGKTRLASEQALRAHAEGAAVLYLPAARGFAELDTAALSNGASYLVIVDDLDAATAAEAKLASALAHGISERRVLLLVCHRREAAPAVIKAAEAMTPAELRRELEPLDLDAVRAIAALYAGRSVDRLPLADLLAESAGLPAAIHRLASAWARDSAAARLTASARETSAGRRGLRTVQDELISTVTDLELARERTTLYGADRDPTDESTPATARLDICPYKGLAAFEASDADYYFGRERLVAELVARLVGASFLGLVGASGSGKSSALRAGLLPALAGGVLPGSDGWRQVVMRPGETPIVELGHAIARALPERDVPADDPAAAIDAVLAGLPAGARLLVVVDQFEEVFNAVRDEAERQAFIDLLTTERNGLKVVVAMRADHYGHCAAYPELARLIGTNQVLVGPLSRAELAAVIEHPAQRVGLRVEAGLTEALLDDVGDEPGALPLLSTALLELWQARSGGRLTLAAYHATGGVRGAVARLAEAAYGALNEDQQAIARSIFLRLAGPGEGEGVVRRRVSLDELDAQRDESVAAVLHALTDARLLTTGDGYIEVAHEALLREWPRLQEWLAEDSVGRTVRLHLIGAALDWHERGREPGDLYRGARLAAALDWAPGHEHELNAMEREFLAESQAASERDAERQRQVNRRLRFLLAGAGLFLLVAMAAGTYAALEATRAEEQAVRAEQSALEARVRELTMSALAVVDEDPTLSKLLLLSAGRLLAPSDEAIDLLHRAIQQDRAIYRYVWPRESAAYFVTDLHPNGDHLVASGSGYLEVVNRHTGGVEWSHDFADDSVWVENPVFTPDGRHLIAGVNWGPPDPLAQPPPPGEMGVYVWDALTGELMGRLDVGPCGAVVNTVANDLVAANSLAGEPDTCSWNLDQAKRFQVLDLSGSVLFERDDVGRVASAVISADGSTVAFDGPDPASPAAYVVDLGTGETRCEIDGSTTGQVYPYVGSLSHDGSLLVFGAVPIKTWVVAECRAAATFDGHPGVTNFAHFGPTGQTVFSTGLEASLREWDARTGRELLALPGVGSGRPSPRSGDLVLVTNPDNLDAVLLQGGLHGELGAFDVRSQGTYVRSDGEQVPCFALGGSLQVAGYIATFIDTCTGGLNPEASTNTVALNANGEKYDLELLYSRTGTGGQRQAVSPDGVYLLQQATEQDGNGGLWIRQLATGRDVVELADFCTTRNDGHGCPFLQWPRWSPDGTMVATQVHHDPPLGLAWRTQDGALLWVQPDGSPVPDDVFFSPDSARLIVVSGSIYEVRSTSSWELVATGGLPGGGLRFHGYAPDSSVIMVGAGPTLHWLDPDTLEPTRPAVTGLMDGVLRSTAQSPDGTLIAFGAGDGFVTVREAQTGRPVHSFRHPGLTIAGVGFLSNTHLVVMPRDGTLWVHTIDLSELLELTAGSLTRGFTESECERFNFGEDCPSLAELTSPVAAAP